MISRSLGSDVYISFLVKVAGKAALIRNAKADIYKGDKVITNLSATIKRNRVSCIVPADSIKSTGDYKSVFSVELADMGTETHAVDFRVTKSVLGKKRINAV